MVCNVLEAKYIKVFLKSFGRILHWEMHTDSSFLKKRLMWSLWLWDPLYQSPQILKCLGDFTAEARETFVGTVECYGFFAYWAIFELGPQNSGRLFFFLSLSLWVCVFWWLVRLFTVSRVSGPAVWPVCHELGKNGDIQSSVPCSWWVFYINWIIGCFTVHEVAAAENVRLLPSEAAEGFQQLSHSLPLHDQLYWMPEEQLSLMKGLAFWTGCQ